MVICLVAGGGNCPESVEDEAGDFSAAIAAVVLGMTYILGWGSGGGRPLSLSSLTSSSFFTSTLNCVDVDEDGDGLNASSTSPASEESLFKFWEERITNCLMSSISSSPPAASAFAATASFFEEEFFLPPSGGSPSDDGGLDILDEELLTTSNIYSLLLHLNDRSPRCDNLLLFLIVFCCSFWARTSSASRSRAASARAR